MFGITGHKEHVGGGCKSGVKSLGPTEELRPKLRLLRVGGERGIPGGAVKCVDIRRNTGGEGDVLAHF